MAPKSSDRPPRHLAARNNLAGAYQSAGDLGRAIELYKQTLADRVRVLGEDYPDTPDRPQQPRRRLRVGGEPEPCHRAPRTDPG
ncbi:tetratricopeptide repeat protein [Streptomyces gardneri]|uniref:tetratricopeptide repeat protein n=1 Tax=Streptomyces gardneri TaxID=66892 RepID=UPI0036A4D47A